MKLLNILKTAAVSSALALAATSASALVLDFDGTLVTDNGAGDTDAAIGAISYNSGGVSVTTVTSFDGLGFSLLGLTVNTTNAIAADIEISATDTGYAAGAGMPSNVNATLNGSFLQGNPAEVQGAFYVDDGNNEFSMATMVGPGGSINVIGDNVTGMTNTNLSDPFSMSIFTTIKAGTFASYDATISAVPSPVPVPAGILLMGTALAGFGVMRRRKKAA